VCSSDLSAIRVKPFTRSDHSAKDIWIVSGTKRRLQVEKLQLLKVQAIDKAERRFPVSLTRHPCEVSKYGPYVSLSFDAAGGVGEVTVTAEVEYQDKKYEIIVSYKQGKPGDDYLWKLDGVDLQVIPPK